MGDVTGPISTLPGARHDVPDGAVCDEHPDRPAVARIQGETDSFGSELHDMCAESMNLSIAPLDLPAHYAAVRARLWPRQKIVRAPTKQAWSAPVVTEVFKTDEERVAAALRSLADGPGFSIERVACAVAVAFDVAPAAMIGRSRKPVYARPRMIAMALTRHLLPNAMRSTLPLIGAFYGGRDHSTVGHAIERYGELVERVAEGSDGLRCPECGSG